MVPWPQTHSYTRGVSPRVKAERKVSTLSITVLEGFTPRSTQKTTFSGVGARKQELLAGISRETEVGRRWNAYRAGCHALACAGMLCQCGNMPTELPVWLGACKRPGEPLAERLRCYRARKMTTAEVSGLCFAGRFWAKSRCGVCMCRGVVVPVPSLFALFARFFPASRLRKKIFGIGRLGCSPPRVSQKRQNPEKTSVFARLAVALLSAVLARGARRKLRLSKILRSLLEKSLTRSQN